MFSEKMHTIIYDVYRLDRWITVASETFGCSTSSVSSELPEIITAKVSKEIIISNLISALQYESNDVLLF